MGITGLIPFLDKASSKIHLRDLQGSTVAVDTYCWLHKGVFACAEKLVRGEDSDQYIKYCLKYVQLLLSYDIKPILVFDGRHLPAKALTERRRRESRQQSKKRAAELLRLGRTDEARSHMRRCVDVTHEMALRLIRECRLRNVDCIVAPYEADAQMAWLNRVDVAQYIVTEDSDLTLFGARKIIFKLDLTGAGLLVQADKLHLAMGCSEQRYTFDKFRRMCILSGCDYLDSLPGIGLAKACKFILKTEQDDMWLALKKIPQYLNMRNLAVDDEYIESFLKAEATFKHMYIYNPIKRRMERLNELEDSDTDAERYCSNAGTPLDDNEQALQLALGNVNPFTLKQLDNWHPDRDIGFAQAPPTNKNTKRAKHKSIWQGSFQTHHKSDKDQHSATEEKPSGCALYFKKVDFNSHSIDEEVSANLRAENAKPEEAEIFSMYKYKVSGSAYENNSPTAKRRRCDSSGSSFSTNEVDKLDSPPPATTARHNPFASSALHAVSAEKKKKSQTICENSSLLKVLSPKKCKAEVRSLTRLNSLKRSIFATENVETTPPIEVKSRFFAANLKSVTQPTSTPPDLSGSEEIEKIDNYSNQSRDKMALLYHLLSSPKKLALPKTEEIPISHTDSGIALLPTDNPELAVDKLNCDLYTKTELNVIKNAITNDKPIEETTVKTLNIVNDAIVLSDDDVDSPNINSAATFLSAIKASPQLTTAFKRQTAPRLGLPQPRTNSKTAKNKTKSSKISTQSSRTTLSQNQTRLSMFGFQKRPTLK